VTDSENDGRRRPRPIHAARRQRSSPLRAYVGQPQRGTRRCSFPCQAALSSVSGMSAASGYYQRPDRGRDTAASARRSSSRRGRAEPPRRSAERSDGRRRTAVRLLRPLDPPLEQTRTRGPSREATVICGRARLLSPPRMSSGSIRGGAAAPSAKQPPRHARDPGCWSLLSDKSGSRERRPRAASQRAEERLANRRLCMTSKRPELSPCGLSAGLLLSSDGS
jgi:hypothetical protein